MLTKKYYKVFAEILGKHNASEEMLEDFIDFFKSDNPLFDETRFRLAVEKARRPKLFEVFG